MQDLLHALHWCDLHSVDPQGEPGGVPKSRGGNYLRRIGGDGTPEVADLCFAELAIARGAGEMSTSNLAADALDLKHRMPLFWAAVLDLRIEVWLARKIARMARKLGKDHVGLVDAAVTVAVHESPGRLLEIAEAKVIEADPDLHRARGHGVGTELVVLDVPIDERWLRLAARNEVAGHASVPLTLEVLQSYEGLFQLPDAEEQRLYDLSPSDAGPP